MRHLAPLLLLAAATLAAEVIDRIAVLAGKRVIKTSDITRDLRVTAFLNNETPTFSAEARRKSAERLIDQALIREQMERGGYTPANAVDVDGFLNRIRHDRFGNSAAGMREELSRYGINEGVLRAHLLLQLTVLRFIDQRFRPGVLVTDEEIRAYYDQHQTQLAREHPLHSSFEALSTKIRNSLEGERINQNFEQWLAEARKRSTIEYKQEAF